MELGISAGAGTEADPRTRRAEAPQQAVTEYVLTLADQAGYGAALIDAAPASAVQASAGQGSAGQGSGEAAVITWPQFAQQVRAAAHGLSRRGLRDADTAGIFVQDAVSHAIAVHAVRAAGAMALPIGPSQSAAEVAAVLKQGRARLLITSAALAELAIQAAERSWVRQVFAFGEAEGTTPFGSLLHTARHGPPQACGVAAHNGSNAGDLDGADRDGSDRHGSGLQSALDGLGLRLGLELDGPTARWTRRDVVVAAPPCGDPDTYTSLLDLVLVAGATLVSAPLSQVAAAVGAYKGTAAIVPPGTDVPGLPAARVFTVA